VKNPKAETRTDCEARIALSRKDEKFVIHEFIEAHNHPLQLPETTHMLASHRKISELQAYEIEMAEDSGLMQKASFQLMSAHVGGRANLGYTRLDAKNYLKERRKRRMLFGEVGSLILSCNIFKSRFWKIHHFTMHIKWIVTSNLEHPAYVLSQTTENQFTFTELLMVRSLINHLRNCVINQLMMITSILLLYCRSHL
jgi:hypothetical protein